jgi:hypothetical protein
MSRGLQITMAGWPQSSWARLHQRQRGYKFDPIELVVSVLVCAIEHRRESGH